MSDAVLRVVKCWSGWRSDCSNTFWRKCTTITNIYIYIICSMFNCSKVGKYQDLSTFPCWSRPVWWNCSVDGREKFWSPPISFWKDPFCPQPQLHRAWNWFRSSTIGTLRPFSINERYSVPSATAVPCCRTCPGRSVPFGYDSNFLVDQIWEIGNEM